MPMHVDDGRVRLDGTVRVEEAEALLAALQEQPAAPVDLGACTHLHPAALQVLMAAGATIAVWPADPDLAAWLGPALAPATPSPDH